MVSTLTSDMPSDTSTSIATRSQSSRVALIWALPVASASGWGAEGAFVIFCALAFGWGTTGGAAFFDEGLQRLHAVGGGHWGAGLGQNGLPDICGAGGGIAGAAFGPGAEIGVIMHDGLIEFAIISLHGLRRGKEMPRGQHMG